MSGSILDCSLVEDGGLFVYNASVCVVQDLVVNNEWFFVVMVISVDGLKVRGEKVILTLYMLLF